MNDKAWVSVVVDGVESVPNEVSSNREKGVSIAGGKGGKVRRTQELLRMHSLSCGPIQKRGPAQLQGLASR